MLCLIFGMCVVTQEKVFQQETTRYNGYLVHLKARRFFHDVVLVKEKSRHISSDRRLGQKKE
jgi:hypothetical protein